MNRFFGRVFLSVVIGVLGGLPALSDNVSEPVLSVFNYGDNTCIRGMSDNGKWIVMYGVSAADGSKYANAKLIDVANKIKYDLTPENVPDGACAANDVTDDGRLVVGSAGEKPAVWTADGGWRELPLPSGWTSGQADAVTPDGRYAVGRANNYTVGYKEYPLKWDLQNGDVIVSTPNFPTKGSQGEDDGMVRFSAISPDGRYLLGIVSYSYLLNRLYFLYDCEKQDWTAIGFTRDVATGKLTPLSEGIFTLDDFTFSPSGEWVGGVAYMVKGEADAAYADEYRAPFTYQVASGAFTLYDTLSDRDFSCVQMGNDGTLFAAQPPTDPLRTLYVRHGTFWLELSEILSQVYDYDLFAHSGYDNSGTAVAVSADGKTLAITSSPYDSYVLTLDRPFSEAAAKVNLLSSFTPTPVSGAEFSKFKSVTLKFSRDVVVSGAATAVQLLKSDGTLVGQSNSFAVSSSSSKTVEIGFRTRTLEAGVDYQVVIPAGVISLKQDATKTNDVITVSYKGRAATPVSLTAVSPENHSTVSQVNLTTNPILLTFDTNILLTDTARAVIYRNDETEPFCELSMLDKDNQVLVYPIINSYLYKGNEYRFVVCPGAVTDITGENPNEEISFDYHGGYESVIVSSDTLIYSEDFSDGVANMLLFDGDRLTPNAEMQALDFTSATDYPWIPMLESLESSDYFAGSHSCYDPAGQSDDWMVTPQCYIPDPNCVLKFQGQSYRKSKTDRLKVYVYPSELIITALNSDFVDLIRKDGKLVFDEVLNVGESEGDTSGEWTDYEISLSEFSGQSIYVAFLNDNTDQSVVMVDNVKIVRNSDFSTAVSTASTVVAAESARIEGHLTVSSVPKAFTTLSMTLFDGKGTEIDRISESGLSLASGSVHPFCFAKELPLAKGEVNNYTVAVKLDTSVDTVRQSIRNLSFKPFKRIPVEEYTGMDCPNCPRGILAMEYMSKVFGDQVMPIAYHTYTGDIYESGLFGYTYDFLNMYAAPSAVINRNPTVGRYSLYSTTSGGVTTFSFHSAEFPTWADMVAAELEEDAIAELGVAAYYDEATKIVKVPVVARFALSEDKLNLGVLLVITEDGLPGYQTNNLYWYSDPLLGEWGEGGLYGESAVYYTFNHVARAMVGTSYNGTPGYFPSSVEGGRDYTAEINFPLPAVNDIYNCHVNCLLVDANTGRYVNAAHAKVLNITGIEGVSGSAPVRMSAVEGGVSVSVPSAAAVSLYSADGRLLQSAEVNGSAVLPLGGFRGVAVVRVVLDGATVVRKVNVK